VPHVILVFADGWDTLRSMIVGWSTRVKRSEFNGEMNNKVKIDCVDRESRTNETAPSVAVESVSADNGKVSLTSDLRR